MLKQIAHRGIGLMMKRDHDHFFSRVLSPRETQRALLLNCIRKNASGRFGREHGFSEIRTVEDFQRRVPVRRYEDFLPWIERLAHGDVHELCAERVLLFEPTSGSSGANKFIPYTKGLREEFSRAINTWIYDLYAHLPGIRKGSHYWSISPAGSIKAPFRTSIPVGFDDDAEYLGLAGCVMRRLFALPSAIKKLTSIDNFYYAAAFFLLYACDLSLVSVWNPTYLILILERCLLYAPAIARDLQDGTLSLPESDGMEKAVRRNLKRASRIQSAFDAYARHGDKARLYGEWWPSLSLVSAWADGSSAGDFSILRDLLPQAFFQPKGLISTEGIISFPLWGIPDSVPAITSHFLEFILCSGEADIVSSDTRGVDELEEGACYTVVLTAGNGLYRYATGDIIQVTGKAHNLPLIRFLSRQKTCDLVGEKLSEEFAGRVVDAVFSHNVQKPGIAFLAPVAGNARKHYALFISDDAAVMENPCDICVRIENRLCENFYYRHARKIGQLSGLRLFRIAGDGRAAFFRRHARAGVKLGDIKPPVLDFRADWDEYFEGNYCEKQCGEIIMRKET